jgi:fucose 4-O-acetylase-like acetyltransferase
MFTGDKLNLMREKDQAKPRNSSIDLLRVAGTVAIVATHAFADFPWSRPLLYTWQVPLFFILSGFFWNPTTTVKEEISRRTHSLAIPYISWLLTFIILMNAKSVLRGKGLDTEMISGALRGGTYAQTSFTVFWFISALFFARIMLRLCWSATPWLGYALAAMGMDW